MNKTGYPSIDRTHLQGVPEKALHPEIFPLSLLATFLKINEGHMDEVLIEEGDKQYTKQDLKDDAGAFAGTLIGLGLKPGDKIAIMTPNCYQSISATFGANAIGVKVVMFELNVADNPELLREELEAHQPSLMLAYAKTATWAEEVVHCYPYLRHCLVVAPPDQETAEFNARTCAPAKYVAGPQIEMEIQQHSMDPTDEAMIYLKTSGSTSGKPKTLPFSNRAVFASLVYMANSTGIETRDTKIHRVLCNAPFQHGYGWTTMFLHLIAGNQVVLAGGKAKDVAKYHTLRPSFIYGTPLTLKQFMESTPEDADLTELMAFYCVGASLPEHEYDAGIAYFRAHGSQCGIRNNYGISEAMCIGASDEVAPHLAGMVGQLYVGPEWLLVDEELNEVKYGEVGEAIVAAESLCQGYFGDEKATKEAFIEKDGKTFFRTGDFLILREDGYVRFVGRKRRFFFAQGVTDKVNCETIEQALDNLSFVEQAAIVIVKDERGVESAKAFVSLSDEGYRENFDFRVLESLKGVLQDFQIPQEFVLLDKIPVMSSGKINYKLLETM